MNLLHMSTSSEGISGRQIGSFVALWLGWTLAFTLAQALIDALLENRVPQPGFAVLIFAAALTAIFLGRWLWPGWRGALGLISIVFAFFGGASAGPGRAEIEWPS